MRKQREAVLITGGSSGIGEATVRFMAERGYTVFAGYRKQEDGMRLRRYEGDVRPVFLDVAEEASVVAARRALDEQLQGVPLRGLVNNAGLAVPSFFELIPIEQLRFQFEVNFFGAVRMVQRFLPLLRQAPEPRIVNVGSIVGRFSTPVLGPYAGSKYALEALSDTLRVELRDWGIKVVTIEPGKIATSFARSAEAKIPYLPSGETLAAPYQRIADKAQTENEDKNRGIPPERVARVIEASFRKRRPKPRYLVGKDARMMALLRGVLPDSLFDGVVAKARG